MPIAFAPTSAATPASEPWGYRGGHAATYDPKLHVPFVTLNFDLRSSSSRFHVRHAECCTTSSYAIHSLSKLLELLLQVRSALGRVTALAARVAYGANSSISCSTRCKSLLSRYHF